MFHDRLEELVAHEDIISILTKLIDSENLPHLLFYGPPGTGKVSEKKNLSTKTHLQRFK
jgi:replication-associated recombination protein RarA